MKFAKKNFFSAVTAYLIFGSLSLFANDSVTLESVEVSSKNDNMTEKSDSYTIETMSTSTKMNLSLIDTPQSISVVTNQQMEDFNLTNINDVLETVTGVTVEKMESDRTQFTSRGFEITNFLIDGVNLPLYYSYQFGDIDMAIYDHIEVVKGASGLTSTYGDPSGTVNLIRKRPTKELQGSLKLTGGSWNKKRVDGDISGALNESKDLTARLIVAKENAESYLDRYETDSTLISGIVKKDFSDRHSLSVGVTRYVDNNDGTQWGGIPAFDGNNYDVSTNATTDWAYRDLITLDSFVELENYISDNFKVKTTYSYKNIDQDANLANLWLYGTSLKLDGVQDYSLTSKEHMLDVTFDGSYSLFGRDHEAMFGLNFSKRDLKEISKYDLDILGTVIDLTTWDGSTATPVFDDRTLNSNIEQKQLAGFFATNYHLSDSLRLLIGSRVSNLETTGTGYWDSDESSKDSAIFTPYAGLTYKLNDNLSLYTSYTTIYSPQNEIDENAKKVDAKEGKTYEVGFKSIHFDDKLNTSFGLFKTQQDNVASWAGNLSDGTGRSYYSLEDGVETKGFEAEISGEIIDSLSTSIGFTKLEIEDSNGEKTQTYIPRKTLKVSFAYKPEFIPKLKVGTAIKYNSDTNISYWYGNAEQKAYTVVDLMANYEIYKNLKLAINVNNVTDKKYYGSLIKPYVTYAEPRNIGVSLEYKF